jgi:hypothetical protein
VSDVLGPASGCGPGQRISLRGVFAQLAIWKAKAKLSGQGLWCELSTVDEHKIHVWWISSELGWAMTVTQLREMEQSQKWKGGVKGCGWGFNKGGAKGLKAKGVQHNACK